MGLEEAETHYAAEPGKQLTPLHSLWAGAAAFTAGGAIAGASHFIGTAKRLEEEGISKAQRLQALPTAAKALAVSSIACCALGAVGYYAVSMSGVQMKDTAEVSSLHDAITLAEDQRAMIRHEFQKRLGMFEEEEEKTLKAQ